MIDHGSRNAWHLDHAWMHDCAGQPSGTIGPEDTMTDTTTPKTRTITLTDRAPVKIREEEWPVIATGSADDDDAMQVGNAPNREWTRTMRVRRHEDGRVIVYGVYEYDTAFQGAAGAAAKRGELLAEKATPAQIIAAIRRVATALAEAESEAAIEDNQRDAARWRAVAHECIADLPAEEL